NRVYLVPALKQCLDLTPCQPREFQSAYTFDTIVLRTPATRYMPAGKPSLTLEVHGVRDPSGALVNGNLTVKVLSGRVSIPAFGTFPDDFSLVQVPPLVVPLKNGSNRSFPYKTDTPSGSSSTAGASTSTTRRATCWRSLAPSPGPERTLLGCIPGRGRSRFRF